MRVRARFMLLLAMLLAVVTATPAIAQSPNGGTSFAASNPAPGADITTREETRFKVAVFNTTPMPVTIVLLNNGFVVHTRTEMVQVAAGTHMCVFGTIENGNLCAFMPESMYTDPSMRGQPLEVRATATDGGTISVPFTMSSAGTAADRWMSWDGPTEELNLALKYASENPATLTVWNNTPTFASISLEFGPVEGFEVTEVLANGIPTPFGLEDFSFAGIAPGDKVYLTFKAKPTASTARFAVNVLVYNGFSVVKTGGAEITASYFDESFIEILSPEVAAINAITQSDFGGSVEIHGPEQIEFSIAHVGDGGVLTPKWSKTFPFEAGVGQRVCAFSEDGKLVGAACPTVSEDVGDLLLPGQLYELRVSIVGKRSTSAQFLWRLPTAFDHQAFLPLVASPIRTIIASDGLQ